MSGRRVLSDAERRDWLRLTRSERVGPITFFHLLKRFGSAAAALDALPDLARRGGRATLRVTSAQAADREMAQNVKLGARLIGRFEPDYPEALAAVDDAPPLLAVRGKTELLARRTIAIVGARNASANGIRIARQIASDLGAAGLVVASGLARGTDAAAHRGALASGTVAVMAGGVDIVYPPENTGLYEEIVAEGAVVSEMPPGLEPQARHFPQRNRIVSGLSVGVVVVEAALKSGSLITARLALEQGRDVYAVPGSPLDPRARGSNDLIRRGAILTEGAEDVLEALGQTALPAAKPLDVREDEPPPAADREVETALPKVLEKLGPAPTQVDEIVRQCQLPTAVVHMALLELELAGRLTRHPGNMVSVI
ncbi:MAG TPA: DNA-processing protein DprA [Alphaproteobacteria bacterium]